MTFIMSRSITRPPGPVPTASQGQIPFFSARDFARGDTAPEHSPDVATAGAGVARGALGAEVVGAGVAEVGAAVGAVPPGANVETSSPFSPITHMLPSAGTSSPSQ